MMRYECEYEDCGRSYARKGHLMRHQKDHANLRAFQCQLCASSFNRRDLLTRHITLSHSNSDPREDEPNKDEQAAAQTAKVEVCPALAKLQLRDPHIVQLEDLYFTLFHPHWPILHQETYRTEAQSPDLVEAVLITGMWMMNTKESIAKAEVEHRKLFRRLCTQFIFLDEGSDIPRNLAEVNVAWFQAALITLIATTYRGPETFLATVANTKRVFNVFQGSGVYDQDKIDAACTNPVKREQYQRLALCHFKYFLHLNSNIKRYMPGSKLLEYLTPEMLKVRVPSPLAVWDDPKRTSQVGRSDTVIVGDLFLEKGVALKPEALSSVVAWNFPFGMMLGCFLTRPSGESYWDLIKRVEPMLFWHHHRHQVCPPGFGEEQDYSIPGDTETVAASSRSSHTE